MAVIPTYPTGPSGWYCPGCGTYHSPDQKTCPSGGYKSTPFTPHVPMPPWTMPSPSPSPSYVPTISTCEKCGCDLSCNMVYTCGRADCPRGSSTMLTEGSP